MKKLQIDFTHCYGIKRLRHTFDFSKSKGFAVYAQNGSMKTSFAKTFGDYMQGIDTTDRIYPDRKTTRKIQNESGSDIDPESIFVIKPIDEEFRSDKESLLLANKELRQQYEDTYKLIDEAKDPLLSKLKKQSGVSKDLEGEVADAFYHDRSKFLNTVERVRPDVSEAKEPILDHIIYKVVFNSKVQTIAKTEGFQRKLDDYIDKYEELLSKSKYLRKGVFNYYNAQTIASTLAKNGFFEAEHTVSLTSKGESLEIKDTEQLEQVIQDEINQIMADEELLKAFNEMNKVLDGNAEVRAFRDFIADNKEVIPEFKNMDSLKQKVWIDYLKKDKELYENLYEKYQEAKKKLEAISKQAEEETTRWSTVVSEFNQRFSVPFKVSVGNKQDVILRSDVPVTVFTFKDDEHDGVPVEKKQLIDVLSQGERKALYILNIIFEIEARKDQDLETVVIVDDIADSFDYKNKYAIIEYLKDIADDGRFFQIILTHNFDFFRTVENRFINYKCCLYSNKTDGSLELEKAQYIRRPFQHFLDHINEDYFCLASIPFVRNLIEYTLGWESQEFQDLTATLHIKSNSDSITIGSFETILKKTFPSRTFNLSNKDKILHKLFTEKANELIKSSSHMMLENKIILSVAIRLKAERYILDKIKNPAVIDEITSNQTQQLYEIFTKEHPGNKKTASILKRVNLITPQNIHINSFMYEPILDMSDVELKNLYQEVKDLS